MLFKKNNSKVTLRDKIFAHLESWRIYSLIWAGIISLSAACIAQNGFPPINIAIMVFFIPLFGWIAGLYAMDFIDRNLDKIQKPQRPIPSGKIKPLEAVVFAFIFAAMGFILSLQLNPYCFILVFVVGITILLYSKVSKPRGLLANFNRGLVTFVTFYFGVFAITKNISPYIFILSLAFSIHDASSNIVGGIRDMDGDRKAGYRSTSIKYGVKKSFFISYFLTIAYAVLIVFAVIYYDILPYPNKFFIVFFVSILLLFIMYFFAFRSIDNVTQEKALIYHSSFVFERNILGCAFIFGVTSSLTIPQIILISASVLTGSLQLLIRKRYEIKN